MRSPGPLLWSLSAVTVLALFGAGVLAVADNTGDDDHPKDSTSHQEPGSVPHPQQGATSVAFDASTLLSEASTIAFRLQHIADPDLPCSGPCMGQKDVDLSLRNAAARCAKLPEVPSGTPSTIAELDATARSACAQIRLAIADRGVLGNDNGVSWAKPLSQSLNSKLAAARISP